MTTGDKLAKSKTSTYRLGKVIAEHELELKVSARA